MRIEQQALVLKSADLGESSRQVILITESENLQEFVIHGFKSKKSDLKAFLQTGNLVLVSTEINRHKNKIINCDLISHFPGLKGDLAKITFLANCYKTILQLPFDLTHDLKKVYLLLVKLQTQLENNPVIDYDLLELYFGYSLTFCFDIRPQQQQIHIQQQDDKTFYFEPETGCINPGRESAYGVLIDRSVAELMLRLYQSRISDIIMQSADRSAISKSREILKKYYKLHLNTPLISHKTDIYI